MGRVAERAGVVKHSRTPVAGFYGRPQSQPSRQAAHMERLSFECLDRLAQAIGLAIDPGRNLPDLDLVDLGPVEPLLIFVEVVATDGPINEARQAALMAITMEAGFREHQVAFVTAYADRDTGAFKGSVSEFAWRSFAWFVSEPEHIMVLHRGADAGRTLLSELMRG